MAVFASLVSSAGLRSRAVARRLAWVAVGLVGVIATGIWLAPYGLSLYHLHIGARQVEAALEPVFPYRLAPEHVVNSEQLAFGMAHLRGAVRWDPRNVQALRLLARGYVSLGQLDAALDTLRLAILMRPRNPLLRLELGDVYDSLGYTVAAIQAYEAGGIGSRALPAAADYLKLAEAQLRSGSGELAIAYWRRALDLDQGNLYALRQLTLMYRELGDEQTAAEFEQRLRYFDLSSVGIPLEPRLAQYLGQAVADLVSDGIWPEETFLSVMAYQVRHHAAGASGIMAEEFLQAMLEQRPDDVDVIFYLAELHYARGDLAQAEQFYRRVLEEYPEYGHAYLRLGDLCSSGRVAHTAPCGLTQAAAWYAAYHTVAPGDLVALYHLADVCVQLEADRGESDSCREAAASVAGEGDTQGHAGASQVAAVLWAEWIAQVGAATPQYHAGLELGNGWTLLGYDVDEERLVRGEPVDMLLYWMGPPSDGEHLEDDGWYRAGARWVLVLEEVENLVWNGGFELGLDGGSLAGFPVDIYQADPSTRRSVPDARQRHPTTVALLANAEPYTRTGLASVCLPVEPTSLYLQAGWMRSAGGSGYLGRRWVGQLSRAAAPYDYAVASVSSADWTHYAGLAQPPDGADCCHVWLLNFDSRGDVYFDNVLLVRLGLPPR